MSTENNPDTFSTNIVRRTIFMFKNQKSGKNFKNSKFCGQIQHFFNSEEFKNNIFLLLRK